MEKTAKTATMMKSRMRCPGHVARMVEYRNPSMLLLANHSGKRQVQTPIRRWEDNIKKSKVDDVSYIKVSIIF
jgi:hypothetical protein